MVDASIDGCNDVLNFCPITDHGIERGDGCGLYEDGDATVKTQEFCDMWNEVGFVKEERGHGLRFWMRVDEDRVREETDDDDLFPVLVAAGEENLRRANSTHKLEAFGFGHIVLFDDIRENVHRGLAFESRGVDVDVHCA